MIRLENISKKYNQQIIFDNLTVEFNSSLIIINGESGSGKTTLLNLLSLLDDQYQGEIYFGDISYRSIIDKEKFRYHNFGFIYQDYQLFNELTIKENLEIYHSGEKEILEALSYVGLLIPLNKEVSLLSGGEKQRLAIARAILSKSKIILADEPTGSLDYENSILIMDILKKLSLEKLVIMISHDKELSFKYADILYVLENHALTLVKEKKRKEEIIEKENELENNNLTIKFIINYIKKHLLKKKIRSLLTVFSVAIGLIFISLSLILTNITVNDIVKQLGTLYDEERYLLTKNIDEGINEIYSISEEEINDILSQYKELFNEYGTYYFASFETFLENSYAEIITENLTLSFAEFNIRSINEYNTFEDILYQGEDLNLNEINLILRSKDIKRITSALRINNSLSSLNNYLNNNSLTIKFTFENSSWEYIDTLELKVHQVILGEEISLCHSSYHFNEYIFENSLRYKSSNDLVSSEAIPWTLKKVYYLQTRNKQALSNLKFLCNQSDLEEYSFDMITSLYDSRAKEGKHLNKIFVYRESKKDVPLSFLNNFVNQENIDNYYFNVNETYQTVSEFNLSSFSLSTYLFSNEDDYVSLVDQYYISEENIAYSPPLIDSENYLSGGMGKLGQTDNLTFYPDFKMDDFYGRKPLNYQEIVLSKTAAERLFPGKKVQEIINQKVYFAFLGNTLFDGVVYKNEFLMTELNVVGIENDQSLAFYSLNDFNIFFYVDNFDIPMSSLNILGLSFVSDIDLIHYQEKYPDYDFDNPSSEINDSIEIMTSYLKMILISFGIIIVISSSFLSALSMYLFITENKKEIGLFKALGINKKSLYGLYLILGGCLSLLSFLYCALMMIIISFVFTKDITYIFSLEFLNIFLESLLVTFIVCLITTLIIFIFSYRRIKAYSPLVLLKEKS